MKPILPALEKIGGLQKVDMTTTDLSDTYLLQKFLVMHYTDGLRRIPAAGRRLHRRPPLARPALVGILPGGEHQIMVSDIVPRHASHRCDRLREIGPEDKFPVGQNSALHYSINQARIHQQPYQGYTQKKGILPHGPVPTVLEGPTLVPKVAVQVGGKEGPCIRHGQRSGALYSEDPYQQVQDPVIHQGVESPHQTETNYSHINLSMPCRKNFASIDGTYWNKLPLSIHASDGNFSSTKSIDYEYPRILGAFFYKVESACSNTNIIHVLDSRR